MYPPTPVSQYSVLLLLRLRLCLRRGKDTADRDDIIEFTSPGSNDPNRTGSDSVTLRLSSSISPSENDPKDIGTSVGPVARGCTAAWRAVSPSKIDPRDMDTPPKERWRDSELLLAGGVGSFLAAARRAIFFSLGGGIGAGSWTA